MKEVILLLLGAIIGVLFNECWKWTGLDQRAGRWIRRMKVRPIPLARRDATFLLGNYNTNTCIIDGDGAIAFAPNEIVVRQEAAEVTVPDNLLTIVKEIETREAEKKERSEPHAWNGRMSHLVRFAPSRRSNTEDGQLSLTMSIAQYYHYMATNVRVYDEFQVHKFASPTRRKLVGEFSDWRTRPVPNLVNGIAVNLFVFTDDDMIVFSKRSDAVAIAPGEITYAVNENYHPDYDRIGDGNRLDTNTLVRRALREELGWDDTGNGTRSSETNILGFAVHTGTCGYGIFGYTTLPVSFPELQLEFAKRARDRHETEHLIPVPLDIKRVAGFVHYQSLYNYVGMGAALALHHKPVFSYDRLEQELLAIQRAEGDSG